MSLGEIITDSIKYPFSNITNFLIVGILVLLAGISNVFMTYGISNEALNVIGGIIGLIFTLILSGYSLDIIKYAFDNSDEYPMIDIAANFVDGVKVLIINIIYFIVPIFITLILAVITGAIGAGLNHLFTGLGIAAIISMIVFIIFGIFEVIAIARFAETGRLDEAFKFGAVIEDIQRIGFAKVIAFLIIAVIIIAIAAVIGSLLTFIPVIGVLLSSIVLGGFIILFYNRGIGLLYADA
nr:DUF4013 domain-containing protein [uncultured Methanobrevibacter sp.]